MTLVVYIFSMYCACTTLAWGHVTKTAISIFLHVNLKRRVTSYVRSLKLLLSPML